MSAIGKRQSIVQLRRMLRRLDRSHSGDESGCPTCSLQRLAAQLVDELEAEAQQFASPDAPGADDEGGQEPPPPRRSGSLH